MSRRERPDSVLPSLAVGHDGKCRFDASDDVEERAANRPQACRSRELVCERFGFGGQACG